MNRALETPQALGYRMPAEWEPHRATWLAWPHEQRDWPGKFEPIDWVYCETVRYLVGGEKVCILAGSKAHAQLIRQKLRATGVALSRVQLFVIPTDRSWIRDYGPIFVRHDQSNKIGINHFRFNGWAKYANHKKDAAVVDQLEKRLRLPVWRPTVAKRRFVLEGGSIEVNGQDVVMTTRECLLDRVQARNPQLTQTEIEHVLCAQLGVKKVLWLNRGIVGDDTHGHIDDIARFVNARTVVACREENRRDANHPILEENWRLLARAKDGAGKPLRTVALPMPRPIFFQNQRLPASYANFYIANRTVLVPTFGDPNDRIALNILADLFPGRTVVGIHSLDLVWGLGTLHCMTQQEPV